MDRRKFIKYSSTLFALGATPESLLAKEYTVKEEQFFPVNFFTDLFRNKNTDEKEIIKNEENIKKDVVEVSEKEIIKKEKVEEKHKDIFLENKYINEFVSVREKLKLVQQYVGYGNFNIISFDEMLYTANVSSGIEAFTKKRVRVSRVYILL